MAIFVADLTNMESHVPKNLLYSIVSINDFKY